jgi:hypothetical protein
MSINPRAEVGFWAKGWLLWASPIIGVGENAVQIAKEKQRLTQ